MDKFLIMLASISWAMSGDSDVNGGWKGWDDGWGTGGWGSGGWGS